MLESRHLDLPQIMGGVEVGTLGSTYYDTYFVFLFFLQFLGMINCTKILILGFFSIKFWIN
jgi:membrane-associated protease RseP (regulator of RpoE activity)